MATTMLSTARGMRVLAATMDSSAPTGHRTAMSFAPNPHQVPVATPAIRQTASAAKATAATAVRAFLNFMTTPYPSSGFTTMARSEAFMVEPAWADTHTASQAPQPLHFVGSTTGSRVSKASVASAFW